MGNDRWKKAKKAINCLQNPRTLDYDADNYSVNSTVRGLSENEEGSFRRPIVTDKAPVIPSSSTFAPSTSNTSSSSSIKVSRLFDGFPKFSTKKKICGICQNKIIKGQGHAIFIAECSHYFHHNCITSNIKQGNRVCPVCRAKWTAVPFEIRTPNPPENIRTNFVTSDINYQQLRDPQPITYDDDDNIIEYQSTNPEQASEDISNQQIIKITTFPDFPAIPKSVTCNDFTILINLKALTAEAQSSRPPVDLVTVLDVSSSMAGPKLALLKRAMGIVIQNMGPHDRLSVIAFSTVARRLFPLRRMTDTGRDQAVQAVDSLMSSGGTDIAEALKIAVKVILERRSKNPGSGIILFSDGLDTYTITDPTGQSKSLLPNSIGQIPVHTFGFGGDHDDVSMELISDSSGGAFTFIGDEGVVEEAVEHTMGGLLTVVTQEVTVSIECVDPSLVLKSINAGNCPVTMTDDVRKGVVNVRDLYALEERDFLVTMNIPESTDDEMILLKINCTFRYPATYDLISLQEIEVRIDRPGEKAAWPINGSIEVDRQRIRVRAAKAMSAAQNAAERGDFGIAKLILERHRDRMSASISVRAGDDVSVRLVNELREMRERMVSRQVYEASGRGYVWSGLSPQSQQRPTTGSVNPSQVNQQITAAISSDHTDLVGSFLNTLFDPR